MSCKIIREGTAALASPIAWPRADVWPPAQRRGDAPAACPAPSGLDEAEIQRRAAAAAETAFRQGEAEGMARSASRLDPVIARLLHAADQLAAQRPRIRREAEEDVVKLAIAIARRVLHRELSVDPAALLGVVKAAFDKLDSREVHRVRFHPEDLEFIRGRMGTEKKLEMGRNIELAADPSIERGSAIFETARGNLDASIGTQLAEIERGLTDLVRAS